MIKTASCRLCPQVHLLEINWALKCTDLQKLRLQFHNAYDVRIRTHERLEYATRVVWYCAGGSTESVPIVFVLRASNLKIL